MVGSVWLLSHRGVSVNQLRVSAGTVDCWVEGYQAWVRGKSDWGPRWDLVGLDSPSDVDQLRNSPGGLIRAMAWVWEDREAGHVRARVFAMYCGVFEDTATGSAALRLAGYLDREIVVRQGAHNSLVRTRVSERGLILRSGRENRDRRDPRCPGMDKLVPGILGQQLDDQGGELVTASASGGRSQNFCPTGDRSTEEFGLCHGRPTRWPYTNSALAARLRSTAVVAGTLPRVVVQACPFDFVQVDRPFGEGREQRRQTASQVADLVLHPRWDLGVVGPQDKPVAFQLP